MCPANAHIGPLALGLWEVRGALERPQSPGPWPLAQAASTTDFPRERPREYKCYSFPVPGMKGWEALHTDMQAHRFKIWGSWEFQKQDGLPFKCCPSPLCRCQLHCFVLRTRRPRTGVGAGSWLSVLPKGSQDQPRRWPSGLPEQEVAHSSGVLLKGW